MDNIRVSVRNIKQLLNEDNLNMYREDMIDELDHLEAVIDYLETKNNSLKKKISQVFEDARLDVDTDLEEIGDILY